MVFSEKLGLVMAHIEVTPEMSRRILDNIQSISYSPVTKAGNAYRPKMKQFLTLAACLTLIITGGIFMSRQFIEPPPHGYMTPDGHYIAAESAEDLSRIALYQIYDLEGLPFEPENTVYSFHAGISQIWYRSGSQDIIYRKGYGTDDVSGVEDTFTEVKTTDIADLKVTFKGNGENYALATWSDEQFSYSVFASEGLTDTQWQTLISLWE